MVHFPPGKGGGEGVDHGYKGKGITIHLLVEGRGMPLSGVSTSAATSEQRQLSILFQRVQVHHGYGRPRRCPREIHADGGYDSKTVRVFLRAKGIRPVIPRRQWKTRRKSTGGKVASSKSRWQIERCFAWMKRKYRRLAVRWERRRRYWDGFLQLALIMMWADKLICG